MPASPLVFAHRGASRAEAENTLAAFARARALGADGVELDVRRTSDAVLVVHHDPDIEGFGLLAEQPFARVRRERPAVPTLDEALHECAGMLVNVEIKCLPWEPDADTPDRAVVHAVIAAVRTRDATVIVSSFDLGAVDACRAAAPELATAWLTSGQDIETAGTIARERGHGWLNPDRASALAACDSGAIARARERELLISVWTVDEPDDIRALARAGVDAIITNVPDVARAALG
jgi:glycerophosphoryl diester phosphodiesterase